MRRDALTRRVAWALTLLVPRRIGNTWVADNLQALAEG
jgi:hypothetical protein